jgi:hypothetical protein
MRGKINIKTIVVMVVLLVVVVLGVVGAKTVQTFMSGATSDFEPVGVTVAPYEDGTTATISWTSDKASISKVEYGTTAASLVLIKLESEAVTNHKVLLDGLKPNTTYYYRIRIGDEVFDNSGIPYTFKTKGVSEVVVPTATPTLPSPTSVQLESGSSNLDDCTDQNGDGVVNSADLLKCKREAATNSAELND